MSDTNYFSITPSDSTILPTGGANLIYVGVTGDLTVLGANDTDPVTFKSVPVGWFKMRYPVQKVMATGTTASQLVGSLLVGNIQISF
jgi:hypothetical protein